MIWMIKYQEKMFWRPKEDRDSTVAKMFLNDNNKMSVYWQD